MYKKETQLAFEDFVFPFGELDSENDWVKLAGLIPWDTVERAYAKQFVDNGHPAHSARIALGALIIKQRLRCSDEWTVRHVSENPYLQFFLGMKAYSSKAPFGASTMVEFRKRFGLCISATLHLPFAQGEKGTLWAEQSMWNFLSREMAAPLIDEGVAKLTPEFLVHGRAYTSLDRPNACAVRARFAGREKTLLVFGDRYWNGEQPSAPANFESMPLGWDKAYGGPDFAANPAGRGRKAVDRVLWLPNIEAPGERVRSPQQQPVPAGFGALEPQHPQRAGLRGTYDKNYLREHAPGFAPDADWRCFNLAPQDQWLDAALQGDETFAFDHMHPGKPHLQGQLPGLRARVFAGYRMPDGEEVRVRSITRIPADGVYDTTCVSSRRRPLEGACSRSSNGTC